MGRPKGSKNKKSTKKVTKKAGKKVVKKVVKKTRKQKKKEGSCEKEARIIMRKAGETTLLSKKIVKEESDRDTKYQKHSVIPEDYVPPKTYKFLGYCPKCDMCLTTNDLDTKTIFICAGCGSRRKVKYLLKISKSQAARERISKKQYLKETAKLSKVKTDAHISNLPDISSMKDVDG